MEKLKDESRLAASNKTVFSGFSEQWHSEDSRTFLWVKIFLAIFTFSLLFFNSVSNLLLADNITACISDRIHEIFLSINQTLKQNPDFRHFLIVFVSVLLDINMLMLLFVFAFFSKTNRVVFALFLYTFWRTIVQLLSHEKAPENYIWENPYYFSFSLPFMKHNGFFYNASVGYILISCLEFKRLKINWLKYFAIINAFFHSIVLLCFQKNYFIDILSALFFSHYFFIISEYFTKKSVFDKKKSKKEGESNSDLNEPLLNTL